MAYQDIVPMRLLDWTGADKMLHFVLFGALVFWLNLWLADHRWPIGAWRLPTALLLPLNVALVEEGVQSVSPVRSVDVWDAASDAAGMLMFYLLSLWVLRRQFFSKRKSVQVV
jgi:hypothetical protein